MAFKKFHIPFLKNYEGDSPMHLCKNISDIRTVNTMLGFLAGYEIDHHSRAIVDLLPFFIEKQLPTIMDYLDSRMLQT